FPQVEDFGIVAAEALACGLPVVARRDGGALDIVREGVTGAFFDTPDPRAIIDAAARCPRHADEACREGAQRFSDDRFAEAMTAIVRAALTRG
ncbi:MAG: glycosyltransferase, partial [Phycisphaerales bacterium]|nr:glycosyltransferase [Phycisphaerales bacterium]